MVDDDDQVAHHLRVRHQHVVESVAQLEDQRLVLVEFVRLIQLLIIKHPGQTDREGETQCLCVPKNSCFSIYALVSDFPKVI